MYALGFENGLQYSKNASSRLIAITTPKMHILTPTLVE